MKKLVLITSVLLALLTCLANSQGKPKVKSFRSNVFVEPRESTPDTQRTEIGEFFRVIERSVSAGSLEPVLPALAHSVFINITNGESGYFSTSQAASVLTNFFGGRKPVSFQFSRISEKNLTPYATGRFTFIHKGYQNSSQIYVSLVYQDSRWVISQFNIY